MARRILCTSTNGSFIFNVRRAVLELPEEYRDVVILHVYGGVPLRELAERRGKSESWGKVTFYRTKALLREKLEGWT